MWSVWSTHLHLSNLICIIHINRSQKIIGKGGAGSRLFLCRLKSAVSGALFGILSINHNILAFEQQIIARYGRQALSKAYIVSQRHIPLATAFKPDE